ncbi:MAG: hypothetical protein OXQ29_08460 [Rhodospirillaceae bacterium]|nr:hypothetical protein [Rhodospirillaceae bacterium]
MNLPKVIRVMHDAEILADLLKKAGRDFARDDTLEDAVKDKKLREDLAKAKLAAQKLANDLAS